MGRALSDGANGIAPGERAAAGPGAPATQATSLLASARRSPGDPAGTGAATGAVTPRRPRSGPPRDQAPIVQPLQASAILGGRGAGRGRRRVLAVLLALLALGVAIAAVVVITAPTETKVMLHKVVSSDAQQIAAELKQLVSENTK